MKLLLSIKGALMKHTELIILDMLHIQFKNTEFRL